MCVFCQFVSLVIYYEIFPWDLTELSLVLCLFINTFIMFFYFLLINTKFLIQNIFINTQLILYQK